MPRFTGFSATRTRAVLVATIALALPAAFARSADASIANCTGSTASTLVINLADGDFPTLDVASGTIRIDGNDTTAAPCSQSTAHTTTTTDTITINGDSGGSNSEGFLISLEGGAFAPGATDEAGSSDEIEFNVNLPGNIEPGDGVGVLGGSGADNVRLGTSGMNLNAAEADGVDLDVAFTGVEQAFMQGQGGGDVLSAAGSTETGSVFAGPVFISGDTGNDTLTGGSNDDQIFGNEDDDTLNGGDGSDNLTEFHGTNTLNGGNGADFLGGGLDNDTHNGGDGNDQVLDPSGTNTLNGGDDDDFLRGGSGNDAFNGDLGNDTATFQTSSSSGVTANLQTGAATGFGSDTLSGIENLQGSPNNDTLTGNGGGNVLAGLAGNDTLNGQGGTDTADYSGAPTAVKVNLFQGKATGAGSDTLFGIENVNGSGQADVLTGDSLANLLNGGGGNDRLFGRAGNDDLEGGLGTDSANGGPDVDTCVAEKTSGCEL